MPSFIEGIQASNHKRGLNPIPILAIFLEKTMFSEKNMLLHAHFGRLIIKSNFGLY
ncbi:MAG: hypothetical protein RLZ95_1776 [Bacteroidota bacterium]|jgi:hypothetical protein